MISLADIDQERSAVLRRVLSSILRQDNVQHVFAQIIDGLPIDATYESASTMRRDIRWRTEASQDSMALARRFCNSESERVIDSLGLNPTVAQKYQDSEMFSSSFNLHFLEMIAIAIHDIAANLFATFHPDGEPPRPASEKYGFNPDGMISLSTACYALDSRYPRGLPDVAGYWAEVQIFGGVVVFDRGPEEGARQCHDAYIHPRFPGQLFRLSESQLAKFSQIGSSRESQNGQHLDLPFACEPGAPRVDHITAFRDLNIYRDRYERRIGPTRWHHRCVVPWDPELREIVKKAKEMYGAKERNG